MYFSEINESTYAIQVLTQVTNWNAISMQKPLRIIEHALQKI